MKKRINVNKSENTSTEFFIQPGKDEVYHFDEKLDKYEKELLTENVLRQIKIEREDNNMRKGWKRCQIAAACLGAMLLVPGSVFATVKISEYFHSQVSVEDYQMKVDIHKENMQSATKAPEKYIKISTDFGSAYKLDKEDTGMYTFNHKDGFDAGKDFWYQVIKVDGNKDTIYSTYDNEVVNNLEINGHKAVYFKTNETVGTEYSGKYDTCYGKHLLVFYDEYGYILQFNSMNKLKKASLIKLAESVSVTESAKDKASGYTLLSTYMKNPISANIQSTIKEDKKITVPVLNTGEKLEHGQFSIKADNVKIMDSVKDLDMSSFKTSDYSVLWDENGKLKPYKRENLKAGNGKDEPEKKVVNREVITPRFVHITMSVKNNGKEKEIFCLPDVVFASHKNGEYYLTDIYNNSNRPAIIEDAFIDHMPCYFKETAGGKSFWIQYLKAGEEKTFNFAYLADEDMADKMLLRIDDGSGSDKNMKYIDISH